MMCEHCYHPAFKKRPCPNVATYHIRFTYEDANKVIPVDHYVCRKCGDAVISSGIAYRSVTKFKLIEFSPIGEDNEKK